MQCNIDAKGKAMRLIGGGIVEGIGWILVVLWYLGILPEWTLYAGIGAVLGGMFMIFEGAAGWCALRAIGIRTPF
jgi:hypothetical protein